MTTKYNFENYEITLSLTSDNITIIILDTKLYQLYRKSYSDIHIIEYCQNIDIFYTVLKTSFECLSTNDMTKADIVITPSSSGLNININHKFYVKFTFDLHLDLDKNNTLSAKDLCIKKLENDIGKLKSELFRYCYLYINGGCYINNKIIIRFSLNNIIKNKRIILCKNSDSSYYNGFICIEKNNDFMNECIKNMVKDILELKDIYANDILYKCFKNYKILEEELNENNASTIDFIDKNNNNLLFNNNIIADINYKDYKKESYDRNYIFFRDLFKIDDNIFCIYPYEHNDKFEIVHLKYNIYVIKRTDSNCGWALNLKIRFINDLDNIILDINIGNSDENEKIFLLE